VDTVGDSNIKRKCVKFGAKHCFFKAETEKFADIEDKYQDKLWDLTIEAKKKGLLVDKLKEKLWVVQQELKVFKDSQVEKGISPHQTSTPVSPSTTSFFTSQLNSLMGVFVGKPSIIIPEPVTLEISSSILGEARVALDHQSDSKSSFPHQNMPITSTTTTTTSTLNTRLDYLENQSKLMIQELQKSTASLQESVMSTANSQTQISQKRSTSKIHLKKNRAKKRRKTLQTGSDTLEK